MRLDEDEKIEVSRVMMLMFITIRVRCPCTKFITIDVCSLQFGRAARAVGEGERSPRRGSSHKEGAIHGNCGL